MMRHVAIITRTNNRTILLRRAIESVVNQTHDDWRHVIVNDGGQRYEIDEMIKSCQAAHQRKISVIHLNESYGMEHASNLGIKSCESNYIAIHDDDDTWEPEFLAVCIQTLEECRINSVQGVVTHTKQVYEKILNNQIVRTSERDFKPGLSSITIPALFEENQFLPISFLFRRGVLKEIGYYNEELPVIGDWDFNIRFILKYDVIVVPQVLANYHIRENIDKTNYLSNSIFDTEKHALYKSIIINQYIRDSVSSGKLTAGSIFSSTDSIFRAGRGIHRINVIFDRIAQNPIVNFIKKKSSL